MIKIVTIQRFTAAINDSFMRFEIHKTPSTSERIGGMTCQCLIDVDEAPETIQALQSYCASYFPYCNITVAGQHGSDDFAMMRSKGIKANYSDGWAISEKTPIITKERIATWMQKHAFPDNIKLAQILGVDFDSHDDWFMRPCLHDSTPMPLKVRKTWVFWQCPSCGMAVGK